MTLVSDWMKLNCGDRVVALDDPRHVGRVEAIHNSALVKVRWLDTGWIEERPLGELRRVAERLDRIGDLDKVLGGVHSEDDARALCASLHRYARVRAEAVPIRGTRLGWRVVLVD